MLFSRNHYLEIEMIYRILKGHKRSFPVYDLESQYLYIPFEFIINNEPYE